MQSGLALPPFSNKWFSYRNSDSCFFHIFFKTLRGYIAEIYCINIKFWFSKLFSGVSFFSPFLQAFFRNKGAPYLLLIWFKVLKFVVRFCKKQCIAHKNEKHARVFDYYFQFIRELITWRLVFWQYVALDTFYSAKNLLSLFPTISANSYQNFRKIWEKRPPPKMFL